MPICLMSTRSYRSREAAALPKKRNYDFVILLAREQISRNDSGDIQANKLLIVHESERSRSEQKITLQKPCTMNNLIDTLAATTLAVVVSGAVSNIAVASEKAPLNPIQLGRTGGLIVFAEKETGTQHSAQINVMLRGYDPVAYFKHGKGVRGKRSIWSTYNGVTYFFASKADKTEFDQNPKKFEPQYGGFCAYNMANGKKVNSDPNVFFIHQGKLYVCSSAVIKSQLRNDPETNISRADNNWLKFGPDTYNSEEHSFDEPWPFGSESTQQ